MTSYGTEGLTEAQKQIAQAPSESRQLITAGPGTGKTHVLISRLIALGDAYELGPGDVLVLSFTRSAVRVVRERVAAAGGDVKNMKAVTFDSFATRLLHDYDSSVSWVQKSYDGRIAAAISLIESDEQVQDELGRHQHVIVDEMQDLVGIRAELVKAVLVHVSSGFTLLGDPAQGIYNFQVEGEERRTGSAALYGWVRDRFRDGIEERSLVDNFRAATDEAEAAHFAGPLLNSVEPRYEEIQYRLHTALFDLPCLGGVEAAIPVLRRTHIPSAVLCRNNGEALVTSERLWQAGIRHRLQRSAIERAVAPWLGIALGRSDVRSIGKTRFLRCMAELGLAGAPPAAQAWQLIKRLDRRRTDDIDLARVAERIRLGNVPDELAETEPPTIIVSTIHRAKGMEFDRVFLLRPDQPELDPVELAEETRILYVAMTRAKRDIIVLEPPEVQGQLCRHEVAGRWTRRGWGRNFRPLWGFEMSGDDIDRTYPPGAYIIERRAGEIQDYLQTEVMLGDPISLHLLKSARNAASRAFYEVRHQGNVIGVTSERFGWALQHVIKQNAGWQVRWPEAIEDLRVEGIDSVAGTEVTTRRCDLGAGGIWLRPRVVGLGRVAWSDLRGERA